jgi:RNA polymerase sigma factor (sigma-70 family)
VFSSQGTSLIDRLANGDLSALAELYDRYAGIVNALALRLLRETKDAEDLVQAVFLSAWRQAESYDPTGGTPLAWLLAMARERALDRLHGRPVADLVGIQRPPRALGYYTGLTATELADQFARPDNAIQDREHAGLNEAQTRPSSPEQPQAEIVPE